MIFETFMATGLATLLASLALGGFGDHDHDFHVHDGHDMGHGHGADGGHPHGAPSIFNIRFLAAFATGFGAGGIGGRFYGLSYPLSTIIGLATATILVWLVYRLVALLYRRQSDSTVSMEEMLDLPATIVIAIPEGGLGQVRIMVKGTAQHHMARSENGHALGKDTSVTIKEVVGDYLVVG